MPDKTNPILSICIVSFNASTYLKKCLDSLFASLEDIDFEVIVVDNNSSEENIEIIKSYPQIRLIANKENNFFARANNQALSIARGEFILLLNPDTEIISGTLTKMVNYIKENEKVGVLGCKLLNTDGSLQSSIGTYMSVYKLIEEYTFFFTLARRMKQKKFLASHSCPHSVDTLLGACLLTRKRVIQAIGPLDEYFLFYLEEVDWLKRVRQAGWDVYYWPEVSMYHHCGKSANQSESRRIRSLEENLKSQYRFIKKHGGHFNAGLAKAVLSASLMLRFMIRFVLMSLTSGEKRKLAKEKIASYKRCARWLFFTADQEKSNNFEHYQPSIAE